MQDFTQKCALFSCIWYHPSYVPKKFLHTWTDTVLFNVMFYISSYSLYNFSTLLKSFRSARRCKAYCWRRQYQSILSRCDPRELQKWSAWEEMTAGTMVAQVSWEEPTTFCLNLKPAPQYLKPESTTSTVIRAKNLLLDRA